MWRDVSWEERKGNTSHAWQELICVPCACPRSKRGMTWFSLQVQGLRVIPDGELRPIFYLQPQTAWLFEFIPITTSPPPGAGDARVTAILRRMLYLRVIDTSAFQTLAENTASLQHDRQLIAISAKLISLMRLAFERPWAFPALLRTKDIIALRPAFSKVADLTRIPGGITASTPTGFALSFLSRFAGATVTHTSYAASLTNRHYDFYLQRMNTELNLRGVNAGLLP